MRPMIILADQEYLVQKDGRLLGLPSVAAVPITQTAFPSLDGSALSFRRRNPSVFARVVTPGTERLKDAAMLSTDSPAIYRRANSAS